MLYGAGSALSIAAKAGKVIGQAIKLPPTPPVVDEMELLSYVYYRNRLNMIGGPRVEQPGIQHRLGIDFAVDKAVQETIGYQPVVQGGYSEAVALRLKEACYDLYGKPRQEACIIAGVGSKKSIKDIARITQTYGGSKNNWVKLSSKQIEFNEGRLIPKRNVKIELHWYENIKTRKKVEPKPVIDNKEWKTRK